MGYHGFSPSGAHLKPSRHGDLLGDFTTDSRLLVLTPMALVVGCISAFVAVALVWLIAVVTNLAYFQRFSSAPVTPADNQLGLWAALVPVAGGLVIGLMARYGSERIRGHGIPEAMEAILIGRSRMQPKVAVLKPLSSAVSIGTGGPFGAEGPIIMTGGALGSLFAQAFHLSAAERKTLLVAGAAAGMAAIFAAPLAAVLLAVELLLFEWKPRSFIPVAAAAAIAAALRVPLLGAGPIFPVAVHATLPWRELALSLPIGIVAGFASGGITWMVYACEDLFPRLRLNPMWWPMLGGAVVGIGGLLYPRTLGVGYDTIADLLAGHLTGAFLIGLLLTKAVIWSVALGSGTSGGVLAPLLIMGGALGVVEAQWLRPSETSLWAMLSMAAMMGGTMRSPLTAVAFMLELTGDMGALPALLIACAAAHGVTVLLMRRSILTEKVARRGHHVSREYIVNPLARVWVEDVMEPAADGANGAGGAPAGEGPRVVTYPDELLEDAVAKMVSHDVARLPVVDRDQPDRLLGHLGRSGIAAAWQELLDEEQVRDAGWLTSRVRLMRRNVARVLGRRGAE
jgi:H+/Cl- antiporter ClcA